MTITIDGNGNITNSGGYTGDGISFADATPTNTLVTTTDGRVGIGLNSPSYKLDISAGTVGTTAGNSISISRLSGTAGVNNVLLQTTLNRLSDGTNWTTTALRVQAQVDSTPFGYIDFLSGSSAAMTFGRAASEFMRITNTGDVGIGLTTPLAKLHIESNSDGEFFRVQRTTGTNVPILRINLNETDNLATIETTGATGASLAVRTGGVDRMRITSAGNVLVGTSSLAAANWVNEIKNTTTDAWPLALNGTTRGMVIRNSAASSGFYVYFEYNGGTNNGSISWSGSTTAYNTTSDARIKENIVDSPEAGSLIDAIRVRSWDFKADGAHWRYGMVAQELVDVVPEAVSVPEDPEMMMGVDYAKLVPMLVKEIQSLRARLTAVEGVIQ